jgi:hypothetical protein
VWWVRPASGVVVVVVVFVVVVAVRNEGWTKRADEYYSLSSFPARHSV